MTLATGLAWGLKQVGRTEEPPGSNHVFVWDDINRHYGRDFQGDAWCGGFAMDVALHGGLELPWQMVSVWYVETWGRSHGRWHNGGKGIEPGDLVVLFGHGVHVETAVHASAGGGYMSLGGNTGMAGRQANGGAVAYQFRTDAEIVGYTRVADLYPRPAPVPAPSARFPLNPGYVFSTTEYNGKSGGNTTLWVKQIQRYIKGTVKVTGVYDRATAARVGNYQGNHGLPVTGKVDAATWKHMFGPKA